MGRRSQSGRRPKAKPKKNWVCSFLLSEDKERVVLMWKERPDWQKGKLNGIGGHIEEGETPLQACIREFKEETDVEHTDWEKFLQLEVPEGTVHFFRGIGDTSKATTMTDELICVHHIQPLIDNKENPNYPCVPNLYWVLPEAVNYDGGTPKIVRQ